MQLKLSQSRFETGRFDRAAPSAALIILAIVAAACGGVGGNSLAANAAPVDKYPLIATPTVIGPVASEDFSNPSKHYQFFKTDVALTARGYIEEEFFVESKANVYDTATIDFKSISNIGITTEVKVLTADVPYKTRYIAM